MMNNPKYAVAKKFTNKGRTQILELKGNLPNPNSNPNPNPNPNRINSLRHKLGNDVCLLVALTRKAKLLSVCDCYGQPDHGE
eukprot:5694340-Pleurochrysis_carterae.AAC.2